MQFNFKIHFFLKEKIIIYIWKKNCVNAKHKKKKRFFAYSWRITSKLNFCFRFSCFSFFPFRIWMKLSPAKNAILNCEYSFRIQFQCIFSIALHPQMTIDNFRISKTISYIFQYFFFSYIPWKCWWWYEIIH